MMRRLTAAEAEEIVRENGLTAMTFADDFLIFQVGKNESRLWIIVDGNVTHGLDYDLTDEADQMAPFLAADAS